MDDIRIMNLTSELNSNVRRKTVRKLGPKRYLKTRRAKEARRGLGKPYGKPLWEAIALQPPPPCDHPDLGPCRFLKRCTATASICPAFTKYVNSQFYTGGKDRVPNRHFDDMRLVQMRQERSQSGGLDLCDEVEYNTDQREVVHTEPLEAAP